MMPGSRWKESKALLPPQNELEFLDNEVSEPGRRISTQDEFSIDVKLGKFKKRKEKKNVFKPN